MLFGSGLYMVYYTISVLNLVVICDVLKLYLQTVTKMTYPNYLGFVPH
uniref:Uncharacterized protein n=1 Tax=Picea sitchensis TaxID=3332 RepID=A9NS93_PICSI|nr:unknown [Picea sitchensis]